MFLEMPDEIRATSSFRMQTQDGQWIVGQFILHKVIGGRFIQAAQFVTLMNGEYVYMTIYGKNVFKDGAEFRSYLNANEHGEVFSKANFECEAVTVNQNRWTLTLG